MAVLNSFKCKQCGSCCRNVDRWEKLRPLLRDVLGEDIEFPFKSIDGVCPMLTIDNYCSIYDKRPKCCRTNYIFELLKSKYNITSDEFVYLQKLSCRINQ